MIKRYFFLLLLLLSACGTYQNSTLKFRRTGHFEAAETKAVEQSQSNNRDVALATDEKQLDRSLLIEDPLQKTHVRTQLEEQKIFIVPVEPADVSEKDSIVKKVYPYKHRKEIVLAEKGSGYVFLFFLTLLTLLPPLIIFLGTPILLYGINVYDPRTPMYRAKKYEWAYRYYKIFYILNCIGVVALAILIGDLGEPMGALLLLLLIPGIIAIIVASKMKKKAANLAISLNEPDAAERTEEFTNTLFRLKKWRWIGMIGIAFPFLPIILIMEFFYLGIHREESN